MVMNGKRHGDCQPGSLKTKMEQISNPYLRNIMFSQVSTMLVVIIWALGGRATYKTHITTPLTVEALPISWGQKDSKIQKNH
jgi:hypothetical protein